MLFGFRLAITALFATTHAAFNLSVLSELPACTLSCSTTRLAAVNCPLANLQDCMCRNSTLQSQLFECIIATCNYTDQIISAQVKQNLICDGIPQPSRKTEIIRFIAIITTVTIPFIILQGVSRYLVTKFWWDDGIMLVAGVLLIPFSAIPIYIATKGFGDHLWNVPPENIVMLQLLSYIESILYSFCVTLPKISILFFYLRIFSNRKFRLLVKIVITVLACGNISFTLGLIFQCSPVRAAWELGVDAKCISGEAIIYSGAAIDITIDFVVMFLPLPLLKGLNLSLRKRIALAFMFATGSFACVTSIYRLKWLVWFHLHSLDATWVNVDPVIWSVFEVDAAIICSSIMTIRPLLAKYSPRTFGSEQSTQSNTNFRSSRRTQTGSHQESRPWPSIDGVELLSQENFVGPRNHKSGNAIRVETTSSTTFEENVRADSRVHIW